MIHKLDEGKGQTGAVELELLGRQMPLNGAPLQQ